MQKQANCVDNYAHIAYKLWYKEYMKKQGKRVNIRISSEAHEKIKRLCEKKKWSIISVVDELVK